MMSITSPRISIPTGTPTSREMAIAWAVAERTAIEMGGA
jgi:hypothetical protein